MAKPTVAIIGKPNVGKSTFFNYIVGSRISIVEDTPGVTRDRIYAKTNWRGRTFTLIDTAGIEPKSEDIIISQMREQAQMAVEMADVVIFLTDIKQGITAADSEIALMLKKSSKPIILLLEKRPTVKASSTTEEILLTCISYLITSPIFNLSINLDNSLFTKDLSVPYIK